MKRTIEEQIGEELANQRGGSLSILNFSRPYCDTSDSKVQHTGSVADFLMVPKNQSGAWVIEISHQESPSQVAVRWNDETQEWENLGSVRYSSI
ncbi:hypothetical protein VN12_01625 [Pirellula sp. SH-Sr6A]|uniref:hypothetical protein n=1 Tax=Pirellula sp. SH-Sr6A TaxID=1632865 RepID=UPI00078CD1A0|nr:hypothetical protein [Pirellula sp. SH-Sr6A]AMV30785.1 hypothetical protein VN12_01625 [Pirellula sp. SH-Sr6A]